MNFKSLLLYVPDVSAAVAFYQAALGLQPSLQTPDGQYAQMRSGDTALAFANEEAITALGLPMTKASPVGGASPVQLAFETEDVQAALEQFVAAGGTIINLPSKKPWGQTIAHVRDLNGLVIEIGTPQSEEW